MADGYYDFERLTESQDTPVSAPAHQFRRSRRNLEARSALEPYFSPPSSTEFSPVPAAPPPDDDDNGDSDSIMQSQLAILEQIQRENELKRKARPKERVHYPPPPPLDVVDVPEATSQTKVADHDDDAASDLACDSSESDILRSQERLLEKFRKQKDEALSRQQAKAVVKLKDALPKKNTVIVEDCESFSVKIRPHYELRDNQDVSSNTAPTTTTNHSSINSPDQTARLGSKKFVVRGTDHTYKAIRSGSSTIIQCMACGTALQVPASAKAVYCTCCHHISSIIA